MLREWLTRLRFLMSPKPNREIDDELQFHIERQAEEYIATGMTPHEARRSHAAQEPWRTGQGRPAHFRSCPRHDDAAAVPACGR